MSYVTWWWEEIPVSSSNPIIKCGAPPNKSCVRSWFFVTLWAKLEKKDVPCIFFLACHLPCFSSSILRGRIVNMIFNKKLTRQPQIALLPQYLLVFLVVGVAATAEDSVQQIQQNSSLRWSQWWWRWQRHVIIRLSILCHFIFDSSALSFGTHDYHQYSLHSMSWQMWLIKFNDEVLFSG